MGIIKESDIRRAVIRILKEADESNELKKQTSEFVKVYRDVKKKLGLDRDVDDGEAQVKIYNTWYQKYFGDLSRRKFTSDEFRNSKDGNALMNRAKNDELFTALIGSIAPYINKIVNSFYSQHFANVGKVPSSSKTELFYELLKFVTEDIENFDPSTGNKLITYIAKGGEHVLYNKLTSYTDSMTTPVSYNDTDTLASDIKFIIKCWNASLSSTSVSNVKIESDDIVNLYRYLRGFDGVGNNRIVDMYRAVSNTASKSMSDPISNQEGSTVTYGDTFSSDDTSDTEAEVNSQTDALKKLIPMAIDMVRNTGKTLARDYTNEEAYNMLVAYTASDNKEGNFSSEYNIVSGEMLNQDEVRAYFNDAEKIFNALKEITKARVDKGVLEEAINRILEKLLK